MSWPWGRICAARRRPAVATIRRQGREAAWTIGARSSSSPARRRASATSRPRRSRSAAPRRGVARREALLQHLIAECRTHVAAHRRTSPATSASARSPSAWSTTPSRSTGGSTCWSTTPPISKHKQIYHMSADEAEHVMRVNFLSCVWTTLAAIPHMLRRAAARSSTSRRSPPRSRRRARRSTRRRRRR